MSAFYDDSGPAFPHVIPSPRCDEPHQVIEGLTKREWYATHAPAVVPDWFADANDGLPPLPHIPDTAAALAMVPGSNALSDCDRNEVLAWMRDGVWDLPPHTAEFGRAAQAELERARTEYRDEAARRREAARFIAWRWHYADMMVKGAQAHG